MMAIPVPTTVASGANARISPFLGVPATMATNAPPMIFATAPPTAKEMVTSFVKTIILVRLIRASMKVDVFLRSWPMAVIARMAMHAPLAMRVNLAVVWG